MQIKLSSRVSRQCCVVVSLTGHHARLLGISANWACRQLPCSDLNLIVIDDLISGIRTRLFLKLQHVYQLSCLTVHGICAHACVFVQVARETVWETTTGSTFNILRCTIFLDIKYSHTYNILIYTVFSYIQYSHICSILVRYSIVCCFIYHTPFLIPVVYVY